MFDGFGNLTQQVVTKGSAPSMTLNVNPANNRVTGTGNNYDAAGNLTSTLYGGNMSYDLASRLASVQGMSVLRYTARNERLTVLKFDGTREVHMRGIGGELIGVYRIDWENGNSMYTKPVRLPERERVYAAGRLLFEGGKFVATDRLGSAVYKFGTGLAVQNGGFESYQLTPWASYGAAQISISNVSHTGGQSMRLTTTVSDYGAYQDVKGLVAGMGYQFQTWVRAESGTNLAVLAVCEPAGGGFVWTGPQTITTEWRLLTVYFTATSNGTARIILAKYDTTGALLWDDVEMPGGATAISGVKMRYYPYGQEVGTATANDVAKFGTYTRDANSGLDYAMNRYYQSTWGRFTSPDPYRASGGPADPGSWNRYEYLGGDPVNSTDSTGLNADSCAATEEIMPNSLCAYKLQNAGRLNELWSSGELNIYAGMPASMQATLAQWESTLTDFFINNAAQNFSITTKFKFEDGSTYISVNEGQFKQAVDNLQQLLGNTFASYTVYAPVVWGAAGPSATYSSDGTVRCFTLAASVGLGRSWTVGTLTGIDGVPMRDILENFGVSFWGIAGPGGFQWTGGSKGSAIGVARGVPPGTGVAAGWTWCWP